MLGIALLRVVELLPTRRANRRGPVCLRLCKRYHGDPLPGGLVIEHPLRPPVGPRIEPEPIFSSLSVPSAVHLPDARQVFDGERCPISQSSFHDIVRGSVEDLVGPVASLLPV